MPDKHSKTRSSWPRRIDWGAMTLSSMTSNFEIKTYSKLAVQNLPLADSAMRYLKLKKERKKKIRAIVEKSIKVGGEIIDCVDGRVQVEIWLQWQQQNRAKVSLCYIKSWLHPCRAGQAGVSSASSNNGRLSGNT